MAEATPRTTTFLVELIGDVETVTYICSRCPEAISLEEHFTGWEPIAKPMVQVFLVAHEDLAADAAASVLAEIIKDIHAAPPRANRAMKIRVTVGSHVNLSHLESHFRGFDNCDWAEFQYANAQDSAIPVKTTNMSAILKRAAAASRQTYL
ncbi:hypothetical protein AKG08_17365 [Achromobacter piechaudii]|uniref:hypothetical protein n=1 Tax=Achromobacter piechaudii TaxID=72556 RepID=UPI000681EB52|nr:hypothetical protein [Achromobacter piechaudii]KNY09411.1 hypothetical protein AKG08_17365 [Achromobacter piechaudii]